MHTLGTIVLFGKFLISQELGVHAFRVDILGFLGLLDTVTVSLVGGVVCASILLLLH